MIAFADVALLTAMVALVLMAVQPVLSEVAEAS